MTSHRLLGVCALMAALAAWPAAAQTTPTTFGTLDNFDVINDTGTETHGFEIELEGIASTDVAYTFGTPYIRYGDPAIVSTTTGVIVRYAAAYDVGTGAWNVATPIAVPPYLPSDGHSCWTGGVADPAIYFAAGCDHFGVSLNAVPTKTTYRWLVAGSAPGTLVPFGSTVSIPAPTWNVTPPAVPGGQPVVVAAIAAPEPDGMEFGDALWVKVFVTELPDPVDAADLQHMVIDDPEPIDLVPNEPAETEWEWYLLQKSTSEPAEDEFGGAAEVGAGNEAVSRRFEFYKYTGYYDPESHEARCNSPLDPAQWTADQCGLPDGNGLAGVGDLIGTHNVAVNLAGEFAPAPNRAPVASCAGATVATDSNSCTAPASIDNGSYDPDADAIVLVQSPAGPYGPGSRSVTLTVTDAHNATASCAAPVTVFDSSPPAISSVSASPNVLLKAPGPKMTPVTVTASASDWCNTTPACRITGVTSNEPITSSGGSADFEITGDLTLLLRVQRSNKGSGRVYSIVVECRDTSGNASTGTALVTVPR